MPLRNERGEELLTTTEAARELNISLSTLRTQMQRGAVRVERLDARTVLIPRAEVERYRIESLGQRGPKGAKDSKAAAYSRAYRERKKARDAARQHDQNL